MYKIIGLIISITLAYSTPLMWAAAGSLLAENCGIVNISVEGMMTIGAFSGAAIGYYSGNPWIAVVGSALVGAIVGIFFSFVTVSMGLNQVVCGLAINYVCSGLTLTLCKVLFNGAAQTIPVRRKLPDIIRINHPVAITLNVSTFFIIALYITIWIILNFTVFGMHVQAVGKDERVAKSHGIEVSLVRYICLVLSGVLASIGGATMTLFIVSQYMATTISGQGFIAIAAVVFGSHVPHKTLYACLLFGIAQAISIVVGGTECIVPSEFLAMVPYCATIIVLLLRRNAIGRDEHVYY